MKQYLLPIRTSFVASISLEPLVLSLIVLVLAKMLARKLLKKMVGGLASRAEPKASSLDEYYYYHLGIVVVIVQNAYFSTFDACLWLYSFALPGILRATLKNIVSVQDLQLQTAAESARVKRFLACSRLVALLSFVIALVYVCFCWRCFRKATVPVIGHLLFPTWLLLIEGFYLGLRSDRLLKHLNYFQSNNVEGSSPIDKMDISRVLVVSILRTIHFAYLINTFFSRPYTLMTLVESSWVLLILWNIFTSLRDVLTQSMSYYDLKYLESQIGECVQPAVADPSEVCTICREELLTCRKIASCGHNFHYKCIFKWTLSRPNAECPVCRGPILQHQSEATCCRTKHYY